MSISSMAVRHESIEGVGHGVRLAGEREDAPVVARVARPVEEVHARPGLDGVGQSLDDVEPATLAHVGDGFDEAGHRGYRATSGPPGAGPAPPGSGRTWSGASRAGLTGPGSRRAASTSRQIHTPSTASGGRPNRSLKKREHRPRAGPSARR